MNVTSVKVNFDEIEEMIALVEASIETSCIEESDRDGEPSGNWQCWHCGGDNYGFFLKEGEEIVDPSNHRVEHREDCLIFVAVARLEKLKSLASIFNQE